MITDPAPIILSFSIVIGATREEFEEVAALYIRKTAKKDKKYRDARRGIKREVRKVAQGVKDFADLAIVTASTIGAGFISAVISMNLALAAVKSHAKKHNNLMLHERQRLKNIGMLSIPICTAAGATAGNILTRGLVL